MREFADRRRVQDSRRDEFPALDVRRSAGPRRCGILFRKSRAGRAALELLDEIPDLDAIVTPVGGGGLISGTAIAAQHLRPGTRVIGVEPELGNDVFLSMAAGKRVEIAPPETIADGLRTPSP